MSKKISFIFSFLLLFISATVYFLIANRFENKDFEIFCYISSVLEILMLPSFLIYRPRNESRVNYYFLFCFALNPFLAMVIFGGIAAINEMSAGS